MRSCIQTMEFMENESEERFCSLPDEILHQILSHISSKSVVKLSALSTTWKSISKLHMIYTTNLDFGKQFMNGQTPEEFVERVGKILDLHQANNIDKFQLFFDPSYRFQSNATKWIESAVSKGVTELNLDFIRRLYYDAQGRIFLSEMTFELPIFLFDSASLTHLGLSHCIFGLPQTFSGLRLLQTLCLRDVFITESQLLNLFENCPLIETLILEVSGPLLSIEIPISNRHLKRLALFHCWDCNEIEISAPNISQLLLCGGIIDKFLCSNASSLEEALIGVAQGGKSSEILTSIAHVKVLTVYRAALLWQLSEEFQLTFNNLQVLQLMNGPGHGIYASDVFRFFRHCSCPLLENIFIELDDSLAEMYADNPEHKRPKSGPEDRDFDHLKTIKISNFKGIDIDMKLIAFLLEKATFLETITVVASKNYYRTLTKPSKDDKEWMEKMSERLSQLPKNSKTAEIVFREFSENDNSSKCFENYHIAEPFCTSPCVISPF